jgi:hypothetical protein
MSAAMPADRAGISPAIGLNYFFRLPLVSSWPSTEPASALTCLTLAFAVLSTFPAIEEVLSDVCFFGADFAAGFFTGAAFTAGFFAAAGFAVAFFARAFAGAFAVGFFAAGFLAMMSLHGCSSQHLAIRKRPQALEVNAMGGMPETEICWNHTGAVVAIAPTTLPPV